ncbi:MAG: hypothetical protein MHM6MM_003997 [Cercozoa sp. M6MM]
MSQHDLLQILLSSLNERQLEAVKHSVPSASLVLAGPGTGKTRVIVARIVYLLTQSECCSMDEAAKQIVALTFTNKAAREMRDRVRRVVGDAANCLKVTTFHSFCAELLRKFGDAINIPRDYRIIDSKQTLSLIEEVNLPAKLRRGEAGKLADEIAKLKRRRISPDDYKTTVLSNSANTKIRLLHETYDRYQRRLEGLLALDFSDLLWRVHQLLECEHVEISDIRHLLIDEFQDTNETQFLIAAKLAQTHARPSIFAVGDADQSIYSWRGAAAHANFDAFRRTFLNDTFKQVILDVNYRSTTAILNCSNHVIRASVCKREEKTMQAHQPTQCAPVQVAKLSDSSHEANHIAEFLCSSDVQGMSCAVLCRLNNQMNRIEAALRRRNIAFRRIGATAFFELEEIKNALAYLRVVIDPADDLSFLRIANKPLRRVGPKALEHIANVASLAQVSRFQAACLLLDPQLAPTQQLHDSIAAIKLQSGTRKGLASLMSAVRDTRLALKQGQSVKDALQHLLQRINYESYLQRDKNNGDIKVQNLRRLLDFFAEKDNPVLTEATCAEGVLRTWLEEVCLQPPEVEIIGDAADCAVTLCTIHAAKGLEWDIVVLAGANEGTLPFATTIKKGTDEVMDEERRLCYVAMTRAKERLLVTHPLRKSRFLAPLDSLPSAEVEFVDYTTPKSSCNESARDAN